MVLVSGFTEQDKSEMDRSTFLNQMQSHLDFKSKLEILKKKMLGSNRITELNTILEFIFPNSKTNVSETEIAQVEFLKNNKAMFDVFIRQIETSPALGEKLDLIYIGQYFGLFERETVRQLQIKVVAPYLKPNIKAIDKEVLCQVLMFQKDFTLTASDFNINGAKGSSNYKEAISCLHLAENKQNNQNIQKRSVSSKPSEKSNDSTRNSRRQN